MESARKSFCQENPSRCGHTAVNGYRLSLVLIALIIFQTPVWADDFYLDSGYNKAILRFELDNDVVWNTDSNFTNGWSIQYHSLCYPGWQAARMPGFVKWVGVHLVGSDDGASVVRTSQGIGQNMITPGDLQVETPQEGDLPYAGTLTYTLNWQRFNRQKGRNFQLSLGVLGEWSLAEEFQRFVHKDLGRGDDPQGWDTQRESEPIVNMGYEYLWRVGHWGQYNNGWGGQLALAPSASLGNLFTAVEVGAALRFGWNMLEGFNAYPAPPGRGLFQAAYLPKPSHASRHSFEIVFGARACRMIYSVIYDGSLLTDDDRKVDRNDYVLATGFGIFYRYYENFSIRLTVQRTTDVLRAESIPEPLPGRPKTNADLSYGALIVDIYL